MALGGHRLTEEGLLRIVETYRRTGISASDVRKLAKELGLSDKTIREYRRAIKIVERYDLRAPVGEDTWRQIETDELVCNPPRSLIERVARFYRSQELPGARDGGTVPADSIPTLERGSATDWWILNHINRLNDLVEDIRKCVYNPHLELESYIGPTPPLLVNRNDWALEPDVWFSLVTPDFDDPSLWGELFPGLKEHLRESPFWRHLDELRSKVQELEALYEEAAAKLSAADSSFSARWADLRRRREWTCRASRTPYSPGVPDDVRPAAGPDLVVEVLEKFNEMGYGVWNRLWELVKLLDQLNSDLLPDRVEPLIAQGSCDFCRQYRQTP